MHRTMIYQDKSGCLLKIFFTLCLVNSLLIINLKHPHCGDEEGG